MSDELRKAAQAVVDKAHTAYQSDSMLAALDALRAALAAPPAAPWSKPVGLVMNHGGITYCCYGMYAEVGHSDDCPQRLAGAVPAPFDASMQGLPEIVHNSGGAVPAPVEPPTLPFAILEDELAALHRFYETTEDSQGYDVPVPMMKRLAKIGLVRRTNSHEYEFTTFGLSVRKGDFGVTAVPAPAAHPTPRVFKVGDKVLTGDGYQGTVTRVHDEDDRAYSVITPTAGKGRGDRYGWWELTDVAAVPAPVEPPPTGWRYRDTPPLVSPGPWHYREGAEKPYIAWTHHEIEPFWVAAVPAPVLPLPPESPDA